MTGKLSQYTTEIPMGKGYAPQFVKELRLREFLPTKFRFVLNKESPTLIITGEFPGSKEAFEEAVEGINNAIGTVKRTLFVYDPADFNVVLNYVKKAGFNVELTNNDLQNVSYIECNIDGGTQAFCDALDYVFDNYRHYLSSKKSL